MVGLQAMSYVQDQPFEFRNSTSRKQYFHLYDIQMVGLSSIQMAFENQTIFIFLSFEYWTSLVFRSPLIVTQIPSVKLFWKNLIDTSTLHFLPDTSWSSDPGLGSRQSPSASSWQIRTRPQCGGRCFAYQSEAPMACRMDSLDICERDIDSLDICGRDTIAIWKPGFPRVQMILYLIFEWCHRFEWKTMLEHSGSFKHRTFQIYSQLSRCSIAPRHRGLGG